MGSFWLFFFYFSLSVLGIGFDWVQVACVFNFVCVGEWVFGGIGFGLGFLFDLELISFSV